MSKRGSGKPPQRPAAAQGGWDPRKESRGRPKDDGRAGRPGRPADARPGSERAQAGREPSGRDAARPRRPEREQAPHGRQRLYGFHSVAEALGNPRRKVHAVFATENAAQRLALMVPDPKVAPAIVGPEQIDRMVGEDSVHQGVVAEVEPLQPLDIHDLPEDGLVLVLDQVTDPHNVGAILRSAAAFGVTALVMTDRHSPEAVGVLAKTASGGLEHVPIMTVGNLAQALTVLGDLGYWRIGLDSEGPVVMEQAVATRPIALVLGAEGKGLRRLTRERCDALARLDMPGAIKSLNVSNAAAVALYAITRALGAAG
ncbi:23S rRNA (guanosine(2251)-2'-O)-methyltransferase RlmB [Alsobacter sp. KACC 23698]|uniref:23S rRNA (Guanosine(2251)-2'-O)-methyltransferase RlmB n=1 Tax=Alsobacter sp. KACC 23698 TaxID=3149229 RepID=A0AAU7JAC4_9HYPH